MGTNAQKTATPAAACTPEPAKEHIETGVDRLLAIVAREKRVELGVAAKELGVPQELVSEWVSFLEEGHLIKVEYTLAKTYLVENVLTPAEVETKQKSYDLKKDAFIRKVDIVLKEIEQEQMTIGKLKEQYNKLESVLGNDLSYIKNDIELLYHFEDLKACVDQEIAKQKKQYESSLESIHTRLASEENRYQQVFDMIKTESERLQHERSEVSEMKHQEQDLLKRIDDLKSVMSALSSKLSLQTESIEEHDKRLQKLRELAGELEHEVAKERKNDLEPFEKISKDQESRILRIEDGIVNKVKNRYDAIRSYEGRSAEAIEELKSFFEKRKRAGEVLTHINTTEEDMRKELMDLILKAKTFDLAVKDSDMNKHIKDLESKFKQFDTKKAEFTSELGQLKNVLCVNKTE